MCRGVLVNINVESCVSWCVLFVSCELHGANSNVRCLLVTNNRVSAEEAAVLSDTERWLWKAARYKSRCWGPHANLKILEHGSVEGTEEKREKHQHVRYFDGRYPNLYQPKQHSVQAAASLRAFVPRYQTARNQTERAVNFSQAFSCSDIFVL